MGEALVITDKVAIGIAIGILVFALAFYTNANVKLEQAITIVNDNCFIGQPFIISMEGVNNGNNSNNYTKSNERLLINRD